MMLCCAKLLECVLYNVTHWLIDVIFAIIKIARCVKISLQCTLVVVTCLFISPARRTKQLSFLLKQKKKIPNHLGIVINEEKISFPDISNLLLWCVCIGVRHISIYDVKGCVKENASTLYEETVMKKEEYFSKEGDRLNIIFQMLNHEFPNKKIEQNGHKVEHYWVYLLSRKDCLEQIVYAARNVCLDSQKMPSMLSDLSVEIFDSYVKSKVCIPDPEIILLFGPNCLMGYLPWHIRLSEIIAVSTHHNIQLQEFVSVLTKFEQCEQRFGK